MRKRKGGQYIKSFQKIRLNKISKFYLLNLKKSEKAESSTNDHARDKYYTNSVYINYFKRPWSYSFNLKSCINP